MSDAIRIGIAGAQGRMGRSVADLARARPGLQVAALIGRPNAGGAPGDLKLTDVEKALGDCDVVIDFSSAAASVALARAAASAGAPALVIGSTGFSSAQEAVLRRAAARIAIVISGNFSIGVTLLRPWSSRPPADLAARAGTLRFLKPITGSNATPPRERPCCWGKRRREAEASAARVRWRRGRATGSPARVGERRDRLLGHARRRGDRRARRRFRRRRRNSHAFALGARSTPLRAGGDRGRGLGGRTSSPASTTWTQVLDLAG